jgi:fumarate reductase subunit C
VTLRGQVLLWAAQRASAVVLAFCVVAHLITMVYAVRHGLSAADILDRTRGSYGGCVFYGVFVAAVAVHAPIGLRTIAIEWLGWRGAIVNIAALALGVALAIWGARAVLAIFGSMA